MKRGTIVLTKFPFTDLSSSKRRPAVIISIFIKIKISYCRFYFIGHSKKIIKNRYCYRYF